MQRACQYSSKKCDLDSLYADDDTTHDVTFRYDGNCFENGDIGLTFGARSDSDAARTIEFKIRAVAVYYTGVVGDHLVTNEQKIELEAKEGTIPDTIGNFPTRHICFV